MQMFFQYAQNPATLLVYLTALAIACILVFLTALHILQFVWSQIVNLFCIYFHWKVESIADYHEYTQSILCNECPELVRLRGLKLLPTTKETRQEAREVVQSMIDTLEKYETRDIRRSLVRELKALA